MPDLTESFISQLEAHRLKGLDAGSQSIFPHYHGLCLSNLPASICHWLGMPEFGGRAFSPEVFSYLKQRYQRVILILVDGLPYSLFRRAQQTAPWVGWSNESWLLPLTSVCPSTTTAALTTLWTGVPPVQHGVLGYEMWLKEYGLIANMISHSPAAFSGGPGSLQRAGFRPEEFLPLPVLGSHLKKNGCDVFALLPAAISRSGLSTMLHTGAAMVPYRTLSDMWVSMADLSEKRTNPAYCYVYWGDLDELGHRFGPENERAVLEFAAFGRGFKWFVDRCRENKAADTLLLLASDHGQISTPFSTRYDLSLHPGLLADLVMPPSGENRLPYFFLRPGREAHARAYIAKTWPSEFIVHPAKQVVRAGLLGDAPPNARVAERLGDWVIIPQGSAYFWWANKENTLRGRHGGLSPDEMLVPLFAMEI